MREGIDVIRNTPIVRRITITTLAWNLAFYGSEALIVPFLRDVIDLDGQHVGWVLGVGSLIGIATGPLIMWLEGRIGPPVVIVSGVVISGLSVLALAVSTAFWHVLSCGSCSAWRSGSASRPRSASASATLPPTSRRGSASPAGRSRSPR